MPATATPVLPRLECRELPAFAADNLEAVRTAFTRADGCAMQQAWRAAPETDFKPATVRAGWRGNALLVFAELEDADIFTRATAHNQRVWELGDVLEIFLQLADSAGYLEFHITPNNFNLQLRFPDTATLRQAQAENRFDHLLLPSGAFHSRVWTQPENKKWFALAEIPASVVAWASRPCDPNLQHTDEVPVPLRGVKWKFSFSRYDYTRGRSEPLVSSTSPHAQPDFHRREEWGTLIFV